MLPFILSLTVLFFVLFVCMCFLYLTILFLLRYSFVNFEDYRRLWLNSSAKPR